MLATIALAVGLFVATNIDNLLTATALTAAERVDGRVGVWRIWVGQWIGAALISGAALLVARGVAGVPTKAFGIIGLIPMVLGIRGLVLAQRAEREVQPTRPPAASLFGFTAVALGNGADNLAAYIPAFRLCTDAQALVTLSVFAAGALVWCALGVLIASRAAGLAILRHSGRWLVPAVFVLVGVVSVVRAVNA